MKTDLPNLLLFFLVLLLHLSAEQVPIDNAPRIITENGNLIFQTALTNYIRFETIGGKKILLNDIDLHDFSTKITAIQSSVEQIKDLKKCNCELINSQLTDYKEKMKILQDKIDLSTTQITALTTSFNDVKKKIMFDDCKNNPCHHGGTCIDGYDTHKCVCTENFKGPNCMDDVDECTQLVGTDLGCQNSAICENNYGGFRCVCAGKWSGVLCNLPLNGCAGSSNSQLCGHGTCIVDHSITNPNAFKCLCDIGWALDPVTKTCIIDVDECQVGRFPCSLNPQVECINTPGHFTCGPCPNGFEGNGYQCRDINECAIANICVMNEECVNGFGSYRCQCIEGMRRRSNGICEPINICETDNGGCNINAQCTSDNFRTERRICTCNPGYVGNGIGIDGCSVENTSNSTNRAYRRCVRRQLCENGGRCKVTTTGFRCQCAPGFKGRRCRAIKINPCTQNPCLNDGRCEFLQPSHYRCHCKPFFTGTNCENEHSECGGTYITPREEFQIALMISRPTQSSVRFFRFPCLWTIIVTSEQYIQVTPIFMNLMGPCSEEYVELEERSSMNDRPFKLGKYCQESNSAPRSFNTSGPILLLKARLRTRTTQVHGFNLTIMPKNIPIQNLDCCRCVDSQFVTTNSTSGLFQSIHYPLKYPQDVNCIMQFQRQFGERYRMELQIKTLDLGDKLLNCSETDFLKVTFVVQGEMMFTACNQETFYNRRFITSGFKIQHYSDSRIDTNSSKFQLTWKKSAYADPCGGTVSINPKGTINGPAFLAEDEAYCTWKLEHTNTSKLINFKGIFANWVNGGDCSVYLKIININNDGEHIIVWQMCQREKMLQNLKRQLDGDIVIIFGKSKGVSTPAFTITVEYMCGVSVDMDLIPRYEFQSDNYPDNYDDNSNCFYRFQTQTKKIAVTFSDFDVNDETPCNSDYLEIIGSSSLSFEKKFCNGNKDLLIPISKHQLSDSLNFHFRTNSSGSGQGFRASVTSFECGGPFFLRRSLYIAYPESHLNLSTYNLNNEYGHNKNCTWDIYSPPGSYMFVIFDHFHLETHRNCMYDYVALTHENITKRYCGNAAENVVTTTNRLRIQFVSDSSIAGEGFQMRIYSSSIDRYCHEIIEASKGIIFSPKIDILTRPYLCYYSIKVPKGRKVGLNVTISGAEFSNSRSRFQTLCLGGAKLKIMNGVLGSTVITSLCLNNPQKDEIITNYNVATIVYLVPSYRSALEFNFTIQFYSVDEECGSIHNDLGGEIASPNYPLFAPPFTFCRWQINAKPGQKISIIISHIRSGSVDDTNRCDDKHPVIKFQSLTKEIDITCKNHSLGFYIFDDKIVRIIFENKWNSKYRFRLYYKKMCTYTTDATHGRIESDNLLLDYPFNCRWTLTSLRGSSIALQIDQFDLPPPINGVCSSYVEITDQKGNVMRKSCGNELTNRTFISSNLPIMIKHSVDRSTPINILREHSGLILEYQAQGCIQNLAYEPHEEFAMDNRIRKTGEIKSPQYPNSVSNVDCLWNFETIPGYSIKLTFDIIEFDSFINCSEGPILKLWESDNTNEESVQDICQSTNGKPMVYQSSTHRLTMKFLSAMDANGGQRRFHGKFEFVNTSCEYDMTLSNGLIQSPNYPNVYPNNARCSWKLTVRESMAIHLQFLDFELEGGLCRHDYVEIFSPVDNDLLSLQRLCDKITNLTSLHIESISNQMLITFHTDWSIVKKGFKAKFFEGCGGLRMATGKNELLLTPNYPHAYSLPDGICEWTLAANTSDQGSRIFFYFMGFEGSTSNPTTNCSLTPDSPPDNSLTIIDGTGESSSVKAILCSTQPYHPIISTGHYLKVVLRSVTGHAIFKASYGTGSSACGGNFYLDDGIITSPFYPNAVNMDINCFYIIQNSPGSEINLIFEDFTRQNMYAYLPHDFLDIRSGPNDTSPLVGRFYTISNLQNVTSSLRFNNSVWLRLRSQGGDYTNNIKFLARYHINYINTFRSDQGVLASPQFGHVYNQDTQMTWTIESESSEALQITFEQFSVGRKLADGDCSRGHLRITDSNGISTFYCGPTIPPVKTFSSPITIELSALGYRYPGFLLRWDIPRNETHTKIDRCSYLIKASKYPQILTSPIFDRKNRNCQWIIDADSDSFLEIRMLNFSLEQSRNCKYESFNITFRGLQSNLDFYPRTIQKTMCGTPNISVFNFLYEYYFNRIQLNFQIDELDIFPGFRLSYQKSCGRNIIDSIEGWIQNDEYPNMMSEYKNCTYRLSLQFTRRRFQLNIRDLNLPPKTNGKCKDGYLEISTRRFNATYCGTSVPQSLTPLLTNASIVVIRLVGDFQKYSTYTGFQLKYSLEEVEECGGTHYLSRFSDNLILTNPRNISQWSPHYIECPWYISSPYGTRMQINFDLVYFSDWDDPNGQCANSYLAFHDGSTRLAPKIGGINYCHKENSLITTGNLLTVIFRNVKATVRFLLRITISSCGGQLFRSRGIISSPNYPLSYPAKSNCTWTIQGRPRNSLIINFLDLQLDFDCSKSNLQFISLLDGEESLQWSNCNRTDLSFHVLNNKLKILFTTNTTSTKKGFQLKYNSNQLKCGGRFSDPSGLVESTNYPSSLPPFVYCQWAITVDVSQRIVITIINLNLRRGCFVVRGTNYNRYRRKICDSNLENYEIDTKMSSVVAYMYGQRGNRVSFRYHSNLPSLCGAHIRPDVNGTGIISIESPSAAFCAYVVHNFPENEGTIVFNLITFRGLICQSNSLKLESVVSTGSTRDMTETFFMCNSSDNGNFIKVFATMAKRVDFTFSQDSDLNLTNVKVEVEYKYNRCGGVLTDPYGTIMSPGYPEKYPDFADCEWLLKAPDSMHISILIRSLHLEPQTTCKFDHLYIRYGALSDSPPFKKYCGKHNIENETIIFRNNLLRLSFHSDHSIRKDGFLIEYTFIDAVDNCNGVMVEYFVGSIMSPNYPQAYPSNLRCNWTIIVPQGYRISATFATPFDIEAPTNGVCKYDSLKIYDSNPNNMIAKLCGNVPPSKPILSSTNRIGFVFYTDFNHNLDGFKAMYKTVCGGVFNETSGRIQSPSEIKPTSKLNCSFIIPKWNNSLTVVIIQSNLRSCIFSSGRIQVFLKSRFDNYYLSREICGKSTKPIVIMHTGTIMLQYNDLAWNVRSYPFSATYLHDVNVKEFRNMTESTFIYTPQFPTPYHHNADMYWRFDAPDRFLFYVKITKLDIELGSSGCNYDYLAFYNNNSTNSSNRVNIFCGSLNDIALFKVESNVLTVHFYSDSSHYANHSGFAALIKPTPGPLFGCGGIINVTEGTIGYLSSVDLNNDGVYDNNLHCDWQLIAPFGNSVKITFENSSVNLERRYKNRCAFDSLIIYDGPYSISPVLQTVCDRDQIDPIISGGNILLVTFSSDESIGGRGFKLMYTSVVSRGHVMTTATNSSKTLQSPDYPNDSPFDSNLYAEINTVNGSDHIIVEVTDLQIRSSVNCSIDRLILQDISANYRNKIRKICKPLAIPYVFISSHDKLVVKYQIGPSESSMVSQNKRFSLTYKIYSCNRTEKAYSGSIINIETYKRSTYGNNQYCNLTLTAPEENLRFQFYFKTFRVEGSLTCRYDYMQFIFGKPAEQQFALPKICGTHLPASFVSNSSQVTMVFFSDANIQREGFHITYVVNKDPNLKCGGDIELDSGVITSPGYGHNYYEEGQCIWNIELLSEKLLQWKITDLGFGNATFSGEACQRQADFVRISNGNTIWDLCGNVFDNQPVPVGSNRITVQYISRAGGTGIGFRLEWDIAEIYNS